MRRFTKEGNCNSTRKEQKMSVVKLRATKSKMDETRLKKETQRQKNRKINQLNTERNYNSKQTKLQL